MLFCSSTLFARIWRKKKKLFFKISHLWHSMFSAVLRLIKHHEICISNITSIPILFSLKSILIHSLGKINYERIIKILILTLEEITNKEGVIRLVNDSTPKRCSDKLWRVNKRNGVYLSTIFLTDWAVALWNPRHKFKTETPCHEN